MFDKALSDFWLYFATVDPFSTLIVFTGLTARLNSKAKAGVAFKAVLIASAILVCSLAFGQVLLEAINVRISAFQIAGGLVLFIFGLQMFFMPMEEADKSTEGVETQRDISVFPLAVPSIAGPGPILAVILATENSTNTLVMQAVSGLSLLAVLGLSLLLLLLADRINRIIGKTGEQVLIRISGLILASLACEFCIEAFERLLS